MQIDAEVDKLTLGCRVLAEQEIIDGFGHLSARVPGQDNLFIISRQMSPALVTAGDFIVMDLEGQVVEGEGFPNQEWPIHACVYRARSDVNSVLHSHSMWSRVWSLVPGKFRGVLAGQTYEWNDGLPVFRDAGLIRNVTRGDKVAGTLGQGSAMFLRSHGDVVVGRDVVSTVLRSISLKENARVLHAALVVGEPDYWGKEEALPWTEPPEASIGGRTPPTGGLANRAWEYYEARVTGRLRKLLNLG